MVQPVLSQNEGEKTIVAQTFIVDGHEQEEDSTTKRVVSYSEGVKDGEKSYTS